MQTMISHAECMGHECDIFALPIKRYVNEWRIEFRFQTAKHYRGQSARSYVNRAIAWNEYITYRSNTIILCHLDTDCSFVGTRPVCCCLWLWVRLWGYATSQEVGCGRGPAEEARVSAVQERRPDWLDSWGVSVSEKGLWSTAYEPTSRKRYFKNIGQKLYWGISWYLGLHNLGPFLF